MIAETVFLEKVKALEPTVIKPPLRFYMTIPHIIALLPLFFVTLPCLVFLLFFYDWSSLIVLAIISPFWIWFFLSIKSKKKRRQLYQAKSISKWWLCVIVVAFFVLAFVLAHLEPFFENIVKGNKAFTLLADTMKSNARDRSDDYSGVFAYLILGPFVFLLVKYLIRPKTQKQRYEEQSNIPIFRILKLLDFEILPQTDEQVSQAGQVYEQSFLITHPLFEMRYGSVASSFGTIEFKILNKKQIALLNTYGVKLKISSDKQALLFDACGVEFKMKFPIQRNLFEEEKLAFKDFLSSTTGQMLVNGLMPSEIKERRSGEFLHIDVLTTLKVNERSATPFILSEYFYCTLDDLSIIYHDVEKFIKAIEYIQR